MGIDHGGPDIFVTEQFLYRADVVAVLQQMGGEAVPRGMTAAMLVDFGGGYALFHRTLDGRLAEVVTPCLARARVDGCRAGGE